MIHTKNNLYLYLGISDERFEKKIKPFMDNLFSKGGKVDQALMAVENNTDLHLEEVAYCCYCIGHSAALHEVNVKTGGLAKRFGLLSNE